MTELQTRIRELRAPEEKQTFHTKVDYRTKQGNEKSAFFDVEATDPAQAEFEATKLIVENGQRRCDKVLDVAVSLDQLKPDMPTEQDRAKAGRKVANRSETATAALQPAGDTVGTGDSDIAQPRRRGRPPGSKNKPKVHAQAHAKVKNAARNTVRSTARRSKQVGSNIMAWIAGAVGAIGLSAIGALALNRK